MADDKKPTTNMDKLEKNMQDVNTAIDFFNPDHFGIVQRMAKTFIYSDLVPDMYRVSDKNPEEKAIANSLIALDMAHRIGTNPLMVMQNLVVIHGKPSWSSKFLISSVNTSNKYDDLEYKWEDLGEISDVPYTEYEWKNGKFVPKIVKFAGPIQNIQCTAYTRRKGSEAVIEGPPITIEMAIKEGWYTKNGSKWQTMPKLMLMYRAASFWVNTHSPEISMGMRTTEEEKDIEDATYTIITEKDKVDGEIKANANKEEVDIAIPTEEPAEDTTGLSNEDKAAIEAEEAAQSEMFNDKNKKDNRRKPGFSK